MKKITKLTSDGWMSTKYMCDKIDELCDAVNELQEAVNPEILHLGFVRQYFGDVDDDRKFTAKEIWEVMNRFAPLAVKPMGKEEYRTDAINFIEEDQKRKREICEYSAAKVTEARLETFNKAMEYFVYSKEDFVSGVNAEIARLKQSLNK